MPATVIGNSLAVLLCLSFTVMAFAREGERPERNNGDGTTENPYVVPMTSTDARVDGVLDDEAWRNALVIDLKYETQPGENIEPPVRTEVLLTCDRGHLIRRIPPVLTSSATS